MPRSYVNNSMNRSLGRVGMPLGSMPISSGSRGSSGYGGASSSSSHSSGNSSGGSNRSYVDNSMNRSLGRVGMAVGSMPVSSGSRGSSGYGGASSGPSSYSGSSQSKNSSVGSNRSYVDNSMNRGLGRVGMPLGSMPVSSGSKGSSGYGSAASSSSHSSSGLSSYSGSSQSKNSSGGSKRLYVDNSMNRGLGRVGMPVGSMPVSSGSKGSSGCSPSGSGSVGVPVSSVPSLKKAGKFYVDNQYNRKLGRVGLPMGTMPVSVRMPLDNKARTKDTPRQYVDNAFNRKLNRVGKIIGTAPHKKNDAQRKSTGAARRSTNTSNPVSRRPSSAERNYQDYQNDFYQPSEGSFKQAVEPADFTLLEEIGKGKFSEVFAGKWDGCDVAVKKLHVREVEDVLNEIVLLRSLDHCNIVSIFGVCSPAINEIWLVMEKMEINLCDALCLIKEKVFDFSEQERLHIIQQCTAGLNYLHEYSVTIGDLRTSKILLNAQESVNITAKITSYGLAMAKKQNKDPIRELDLETVVYSAPEVLKVAGNGLEMEAFKMADIYSLAVVMFEVIFEEIPVSTLDPNVIKLTKCMRQEMPALPCKHGLNEEFATMIEKCWSFKPSLRCTAAEVLAVLNAVDNLYQMDDDVHDKDSDDENEKSAVQEDESDAEDDESDAEDQESDAEDEESDDEDEESDAQRKI